MPLGRRNHNMAASKKLVSIIGVLAVFTLLVLTLSDRPPTTVSIQGVTPLDSVDVRSISSLRQSLNNKNNEQCRWYLAESAIPHAGLGVFTATGILPDEMVGFPDICLFIGDAPREKTHIRTHTWGKYSFFGQFEGSNSRAACEGFQSIFNILEVIF